MCFLSISLVDICGQRNCQLVYVQNLLAIVNDDNVWLEVGDAEVGYRVLCHWVVKSSYVVRSLNIDSYHSTAIKGLSFF